jgi:hypothetical protein
VVLVAPPVVVVPVVPGIPVVPGTPVVLSADLAAPVVVSGWVRSVDSVR